MAALAKDEEVFRAAVDAFRAYDGESMAKLLDRHQLSAHCEIICHWLRSKEAVLLCLELAGPPPLRDESPPDPREFAQLVAKLTADDAMVRLMVDAVEDRDTSAWSTLIEKNDLRRFSHLLCHWVCTVHYRLVCDVVCQPLRVQRPQLGLSCARRARRSAASPPTRPCSPAPSRPCWRAAARRWRARWRAAARAVLLLPLRVVLQLALHARLPAAVPDLPVREVRVADRGDARLRARARWDREDDARTAHGGDAARGPGADPGAREGVAVRALLHPVLPLGLLPALPAVLHLRLPAADDRRLHQDRRPLLQQRRPQPQPRQRAHGRRRPGLLLQPAPQWRPVGRRRRAADRVPLPDDRDDRGRRALGQLDTGHAGADRLDQPRLLHPADRRPAVRGDDPVWVNYAAAGVFTITPTPTAGSRCRRCSRWRRWCPAPAGVSSPART